MWICPTYLHRTWTNRGRYWRLALRDHPYLRQNPNWGKPHEHWTSQRCTSYPPMHWNLQQPNSQKPTQWYCSIRQQHPAPNCKLCHCSILFHLWLSVCDEDSWQTRFRPAHHPWVAWRWISCAWAQQAAQLRCCSWQRCEQCVMRDERVVLPLTAWWPWQDQSSCRWVVAMACPSQDRHKQRTPRVSCNGSTLLPWYALKPSDIHPNHFPKRPRSPSLPSPIFCPGTARRCIKVSFSWWFLCCMVFPCSGWISP